MKKIFIIASLVLLLYACHNNSSASNSNGVPADSSFTIRGTIKGIGKGLALLTYIDHGEVKVDSAIISNSKFSLTGKLQEPQEVQLSFINDGYNGGITFFAENAVISIGADTAGIDAPLIEGSASQKDLEAYYKAVLLTDSKSKDLNKTSHDIFEQGKLTKAVADSLSTIGRQLDSERTVIIASFVQKNPASPVSAWAINRKLLAEPNLKILESLFNQLSAANKSGTYGQIIAQAIASAKATAIGFPAADFVQPDTSGKQISLASFKGKYLLVDFWASWCGPCRAESPNLVKAYQQYNKKGFEILGVSLDAEKDLWVKAFVKDKLTWTQVSDLKAWNNAAAQSYGIKGIPFNLLLDKNGIIIAKNLRGAALDKQLAPLFK